MRRLVYIAGPFSAPSPDETAQNVERARLLGILAAKLRLAPIVPHLHGAAGLYGTEHDDGQGSATRTKALACSTATAWMVGNCCGHLWVILRDDRSLSAGCQAELEAWTDGQRNLARQQNLMVEPPECEPGLMTGREVYGMKDYFGHLCHRTWAGWLSGLDEASVAVPEALRSLDSLGGKR